MICFIALFVFAILGIFSATHRKLAREAFDCVFRKATFRKCHTDLDKRLRADISAALIKINPKAGRWAFKHFTFISYAFTIIFIWSIVSMGIGGYNYYLYGNCNGPNEEGFCIFDPTGQHSGSTELEGQCIPPELRTPLTLQNVSTDYFLTYNYGEQNKILFIGCYACQYSRTAYPTIKKLFRDDITYSFAHFPVKGNHTQLTKAVNCLYDQAPDKVLSFNEILFNTPIQNLNEQITLTNTLAAIGMNNEEINTCISSPEAELLAKKQKEEIQKTGIYGTPLIFINEEPIVGAKPLRIYKRYLK